MGFTIKKATKEAVRLRFALIGPSGSGKTFSVLAIATQLGQRVIVIDTERGSAAKYADLFSFDVLELDTFAPDTYCDAIRACEDAGADVVVIDSLSHAWMGKDGALEMVDKAAARSNSRNSFDAWRSVTPQHNRLVDTMLRCKPHLLVTMRSKMEYVIEEDGRGKKVPRKVGLAPVQRDGLEYEFDVLGEMNADHQMIVTKSRCSVLADQVFDRPGAQVAAVLRAWMTDAPKTIEPQQEPKPREESPKEPDTLASVLADVVALASEDAVLAWWAINRNVFTQFSADQSGKVRNALTRRVATLQHTTHESAAAWLRGRVTLADLRQALAGVDLPGECCALWMKHAPRLLPDDLRTAWGETVARLEKVGKMHRGGVWLRKAIAEECERRNVTVPLPPDDPPTGTDGPARPGAANDTSATSTPVAHGATPASAPQALDVVDAPDARSDGGDDLSTRAARRKHLGTKHHERAVVASYAAHCGLPHYLDDCTARLTEIVAPDGTRLSELTARKRLVDARNKSLTKHAQSAMEKAA